MAQRRQPDIVLRGAGVHNLAGFDLRIPRERLTVITGVSGSGKSSLAFDTLFREGQRRFLETLPAFARQFAGGLARAQFRSLEGLGPAVALGQQGGSSNPRSTVGTLTEIWDLLRLLYARLGTAPEGIRPTRSLFSFNTEEGACPTCRGLGLEDRLDLDLLVADPARTLREGALRVSTPNGYLMYSQVTLPVLDEVLRAHGGSVDLPWHDLGEEARRVVLYGSDRLKVPYGKHPLESRLKWTGITARPRQEGFYRGLVPVMEEILRGKRNDSILRFVRSGPCSACGGTRLRPEALAVTWGGWRITDLAALPLRDLRGRLAQADAGASPGAAEVWAALQADLLARCDLALDLGLGYLTLDRPAPSLSRGEAQRLRLLGLALGELRGLLVVLDEPSAGLHPQEVDRLLGVLQRLRDQGQTVVAVSHEARIARAADWLVDLGPGPGREGGQLLWSGSPAGLLEAAGPPTPTRQWLAGTEPAVPPPDRQKRGTLRLAGLVRRNLQGVSLDLEVGGLTAVAGPSGAGKTSLLEAVVARLRQGSEPDAPFRRIVTVDADPIGRTPRSNAATYTGAFDALRDLFARSPEARQAGLGKGHFSFNTAGGRCEACEGAGVLETGMRHLGTVTQVCDTCGGRRFQPEVLAVKVGGRSIAEVLEGSVAEAAAWCPDSPALRRILQALLDAGLGYLPLGQPATSLSGGEAQRVKLATELAKAGTGAALIVLDEPTTGLHAADVRSLLETWNRLLEAGHTLLVADHDLAVLRHADHILELGPGSGPEGGRRVASGQAGALAAAPHSPTGAALRALPRPPAPAPEPEAPPPITLTGVRTHSLRDLTVTLPPLGLTVVTGPSGSGKTSLVLDTLLAEAQNRFADLVSPWARRLLPRRGGADFDTARGLQATQALPTHRGPRNPRATVGTATELDGWLRLLFARAGERACPACGALTPGTRCACGQGLPPVWAADFSPHTERGACPACRGLGCHPRCDPDRLVGHPDRPLAGGALEGTRFGAYLGEPDGQFIATLRQAAHWAGLEVNLPWRDLDPAARQLAMAGTGEVVHEVTWRYRRGRREGVHLLHTPWAGFAALVEREYDRLHADPRGEELATLLVDLSCPACGGERLRPAARAARFGGRRLPELAALPLQALLAWFEDLEGRTLAEGPRALTAELRQDCTDRLRALVEAGLGHLALGREMASLSGGEAQRVRLATALGGGFTGITYVLDEPTQGLHPRDVGHLAALLRRLAETNAVVVVAHDPQILAAADWVLELGPGAGPEGGHLVASGPPKAPAAVVSRSQPRRTPGLPGIRMTGVCRHNLQGLDLGLPAGCLVSVTGVSGSGKSSLVMGALAPSLRNRLRGLGPVGCLALEGLPDLQTVLTSDQAPPAQGWNSTVLTLAGLGDPLRRRFAATPEARARRLTAKHFSTAGPGGRCEACEGRGTLTVAMDILPDVTVGCEACGGLGFGPEVLACTLEGLSIAEVLAASAGELGRRFAADPALARPLAALADFGLAYLRVGQRGPTLSAGERQRLRLAGLLAEPPAGRAAILLDEPTRGLDQGEVDRLVTSLRRLAAAGHLVVAVEHHLAFIAQSDWVVDLGPEGGPAGGRLVVAGPPDQVAGCAASFTGQALVTAGSAAPDPGSRGSRVPPSWRRSRPGG